MHDVQRLRKPMYVWLLACAASLHKGCAPCHLCMTNLHMVRCAQLASPNTAVFTSQIRTVYILETRLTGRQSWTSWHRGGCQHWRNLVQDAAPYVTPLMPTACRLAHSPPRRWTLRCHSCVSTARSLAWINQATVSLRPVRPCWHLINGRRTEVAAGAATHDAEHSDGEAHATADAAQHNGSMPKQKRQRKPHSPEVRQKISDSMKARKRAPEHCQRISEAKRGHQHSLGTRYAMHAAAVGRRQSAETRIKISRRMKEIHAQRKTTKRNAQPSGGSAPARPSTMATQQLADPGQKRGAGLVMERAVQEMMQLRQEIARFMAQHEQKYGVKPKLEETERSSPELYDKFVRFVALQDYVRNFESQL